ncbi:cytochrome c nitrite reductase subunit NrfD [Aeromonas sp. FDAARGOS 1414]|uniref:cytochrome c nitrite reductase subunit NrfD n=1 Tax=unclassified Aeromonas TaxID=257493 RepID=UPI001C251057|nr:cytochrome c nitrite reductase subunit NrfD [Aeromonas sp. FDAARGOS 1414]QWZ82024.1 cytochrome c nitrite reductase subunit NrfD [Aeromonas sp. FDAARGOS 1414]
MWHNAFHFDSLVWDGPIAIYLFLLGISAGSVTLSVLLRQRGAGSESGIIRATAILAPLSVILGLLILIFHLARPWTFWKLMFHYQFDSVMSMGVMLFQVYMTVLFAWLAVVFRAEIEGLRRHLLADRFAFIDTLIGKMAQLERLLTPLLLLLAVLLGAYTGFLLSALKTYPMLNNPILPALFLVSGISSGVASTILLAVTLFKESSHSKGVSFVHRFERPIVAIEIFLLVCFFTGLYFGGGQREAAMWAAIGGGFWSQVFWFGVIGIGILLPQLLGLFSSPARQLQRSHLVLVCSLSLVGILLLRYFILYAGQMTVL